MVKVRFLVALLGCVATFAACSSSGSGGGGNSSPAGSSPAGGSTASTSTETTKITVGTSPSLSNVSLYLAASSTGGQFAENHLSATPQVVQSGAQAVPLLLNGQLQFTAADPLGALAAIANQTPILIVASGNVAGKDAEHDNTALIVKSDSGISSAADLSGKTVAVNALNSLAEVGAKAAIDARGGDSSKVKWVELPIPQMQAAVEKGTVAAAVTTEPFLSASTEAGLTSLMPVLSVAMPGTPQLVYLTSKSYAESHPEVVLQFQKAITAANQQLTDDPSLIKTIAATSTTVAADVLDKIVLPVFDPPTPTVAELTALQSQAVKYGAMKESFDPTPYLFTG
jgi:NitT/TauT family transport system substrate-binding protein